MKKTVAVKNSLGQTNSTKPAQKIIK
jgi:hypothetical protein